jgi:predicted DNA-binding ribbon-helix-helix protein
MNRRSHHSVSRASDSGPDGPDSELELDRRKTEELAADGHLKSLVIKRSIVVAGHKTSVSLEDVFWHALRSIAQSRSLHLSQLVGSIDSERQHGNLSSAIRLFVFEHSRGSHSGDAHQRNENWHDATESNDPHRP